MKRAQDFRRHNITVGELVVAVTDAAMAVSKNEKKAYQIADLALRNILKASIMCEARQRANNDHEPFRLH